MKAASSIWECRWDKYYVTVTTHYYQCLQDLKMDRAWRNSLQKALIPKHFSSEKSHTLIINKEDMSTLLWQPFFLSFLKFSMQRWEEKMDAPVLPRHSYSHFQGAERTFLPKDDHRFCLTNLLYFMCLMDTHTSATNSTCCRCLHAHIYSHEDMRNKFIMIKQCYLWLKHCKLHLLDKMYMHVL